MRHLLLKRQAYLRMLPELIYVLILVHVTRNRRCAIKRKEKNLIYEKEKGMHVLITSGVRSVVYNSHFRFIGLNSVYIDTSKISSLYLLISKSVGENSLKNDFNWNKDCP